MNDAKRVAIYCERYLNLNNANLSDEYFYQSLPLCVIDAVFSIGVKYTAVRNTVIRYCDYVGLKRIRDNKNNIPLKKEQQSISDFLDKVEYYGIERFTEDIFDNRQRTSSVNGILKTKATYKFARVLNDFSVDYFQDIKEVINSYEFKKEIKKIPGQKSGISLNYFFMLAGFDNFIKPDRMVLRFLQKVLKTDISFGEAQSLLIEVSSILKDSYNNMSPKLLDHEIWKYERKI